MFVTHSRCYDPLILFILCSQSINNNKIFLIKYKTGPYNYSGHIFNFRYVAICVLQLHFVSEARDCDFVITLYGLAYNEYNWHIDDNLSQQLIDGRSDLNS